MAIEQKELENIIEQAFPEAEFRVTDLVGDSDHYSLEIKSPIFAGLSKVQQHRLVNESLKGFLGDSLHALTIKISAC